MLNMGKSLLVFTGFMGTGKTETGSIVSKKLSVSFFDTDNLVETKMKLSINDIFKKFGEFYFRQIESEVIEEISKKNFAVISCGGGTVLNPVNIYNLRKKGIIINLYASAKVIYDRIKADSYRPLLRCEDPLNEIKKLLAFRKDAYNDCDFSFNTDGLTTHEVADIILNNNDIIKFLKI
ncbi:shikimate kinase [Endomicrobiia bacterium]|nr:shikimate kinase [Endomicrobiia bacterium]